MPSCLCQIITNFKSGLLWKSPPVEKLIKNYEFKKRYFSLGLVNLCQSCRVDTSTSTKLVLSYYEDSTEQKVKGRFEVERSKLERVETVEECANKYREEKYILRWTLKKHKCRKLYLLCDSEEDLLSWINLFKDYKQARRQSRQCGFQENNQEQGRGGSTSSNDSNNSTASTASNSSI